MNYSFTTADGLLGCKDLSSSASARLQHWLGQSAGQVQCSDDALQIWVFGTPIGGLTRVSDDTLSCWLLGDLFVPWPQQLKARGRAILKAYHGKGHGWVWDASGQFALVLWDKQRQELALYRDDTSARTLYYHQLPGGGLIFSDRLDLLAPCPLLPRRLSQTGLHEYLRFLDISTPNTIYDGIFSTEPGQLHVHGRHGLHAYPPPCPDSAEPMPQTLETAAREFDQRLADAVAARIHSADRLVVFLSGGVDSAYLCALAAQRAAHGDPLRVQALTVGFVEPQLDESSVAEAVAAGLGVQHRVLRFSMAAYRNAFEELAASAEYPFADPAAGASLLAFQHARDHADLALDGTGADTLFGIMPARHQRFAVQYAARLPYRLRRLLTALMAMLPGIREYRALFEFGDPEEVLIRWGGWSRRELMALCGCQVRLDQTRFYRLFRTYTRAAHYQRYSALLGNLPDDRLHVASQLTGLTVRYPFFDPGVGQLVRALDQTLCYAEGEHKRILKLGLSWYVPKHLWNVPKHGFNFPFDALLEHRDHALVHEYLRADYLRRLGCANNGELERVVRNFIHGDRSQRFRVWALAVLTAWLVRHDLSA
ncbi:MAG TPA: asparagine synthetase B family protein [Chromatiaceae bacterium]|jgi:asparagine synthase (glutamine-hydrolysing)|nr:MAG: hypothetical protein N838_03110 [Thiohalocapsa sp. PB-PSB1]QQO52582.1 MAG: asparagine synthase [Thiohalocapsa sp. PB-PSB1]HBG96196.1 asparagine synthetase B family protein [Chromatiaceae bacterium]HCS90256.1 asparagine synthetase B family protein [Chromatiaceae bacterium]